MEWQIIFNGGKRVDACNVNKPHAINVWSKLEFAAAEEKGLQYCNVPGGKINGQLIDVSVGVRL